MGKKFEKFLIGSAAVLKNESRSLKHRIYQKPMIVIPVSALKKASNFPTIPKL